MLGNLAVAHAHHIHRFKLDFATRRGDAEEFALVGAMIGFVGRDPVAVGKLPMDLRVEIRESRPEHSIKLACASLVRRTSRLRRMVEEIVGEEFIEHCKVSAALHFLGIPPDDSLGGFARTNTGHTAPPIYCNCSSAKAAIYAGPRNRHWADLV